MYPGSKRGVWFLKKIPETLLDASQSARAEELRLLNLVLGGVKDLVTGLEHHLLHSVEGHQLSRLVVALLAAGFQVELIDAPVVEVLLEGYRAALLPKVKFTSTVEVNDSTEVPGVSVKVVLVVLQTELVAEVQDVLSVPGSPQSPKPSLRQSV